MSAYYETITVPADQIQLVFGQFDRNIKNLEKAIKLSQYYDDYIKFQRGSELYSVAYGEVRYFSTTGRKVEIHTTSVDLDFY